MNITVTQHNTNTRENYYLNSIDDLLRFMKKYTNHESHKLLTYDCDIILYLDFEKNYNRKITFDFDFLCKDQILTIFLNFRSCLDRCVNVPNWFTLTDLINKFRLPVGDSFKFYYYNNEIIDDYTKLLNEFKFKKSGPTNLNLRNDSSIIILFIKAII